MNNTIFINRNTKSFKVIQSKYESFWQDVNDDIWEPETFKIFERFISKDVTFIDVGAWIGPTLLYAAQLAKAAFAFEPDPLAYQEMLANVELNPEITNIKIYEALIGITSGKAKLGSRDEGGDSTSSVLFSEMKTSWIVDSISLPDFVKKEGLHSPLFIKIDIEGGEYSLLPKLTNFFQENQPLVLYLSLHPEFLLIDPVTKEKDALNLKQAIKLMKAHWDLSQSLRSFKYIYDTRGNRTSLWSGLFKALRGENIIAENAIIATNQPWEQS